ncbi:MAG: succinylglutamate desuccinylase/aspartoacylase family protein, partial [Patescibacteria group bacterium]
MKLFSSSRIILQNVDLGEIKVSMPIADLKGSTSGPTVVITAGMDGDEYTGILAAYDLIEHYSNTPFQGRIVVLPVMNIPGFYAGTSLNPEDGKFPKYIFPGSSSGSSTERLLHW